MTNFQVGQKVRIKPDAEFPFEPIQKAFERAGFEGEVIELDGKYLIVAVPGTDMLSWEYFAPDELEPIEGEG